jgi:hypothetical protein
MTQRLIWEIDISFFTFNVIIWLYLLSCTCPGWGITFLVDRGSIKSHYLTKIKIILSRIKNSKQNYLLFLTNKLTVSKENLPCPWFLERDVKWALEVKTWKRSSRCSWATSLFQQGGHFAVTFGGRKNLHWIKLTSLKDLGKGLCEKENCILLLTNFTWGEVKQSRQTFAKSNSVATLACLFGPTELLL